MSAPPTQTVSPVDLNRWIDRSTNTRKHNQTSNRNNRPRGVVRRSDKTMTSLETLDQCHILVVGGGPAGLSAALTAKRALGDQGRVILMERFNCFGGVITTVGMETIGWYRYEGTVDCEGSIGLELERVARSLGASRKFHYNDSECLDAERFKKIADDLVLDAGIVPLLHCYCVDVEMSNGRITSVITESKSGRCRILIEQGGCVIDCTGDADVAYLANCPCTIIDSKESLGLTSVFNASNVDVKRFLKKLEKRTYRDWGDDWTADASESTKNLGSPYLEIGEDETNEHCTNLVGSWSSLDENAGEATNLNLVHLKGFSPLSVKDLTSAEILGRKQTSKAIEMLRKELPGFENAKVRNHSMTIGVRDSRKIVGEYNLTLEDCTSEARFEDAVGVFPEFLDGYTILMLPTSGRYFHVPLRALVPKEEVELAGGLIVPGNLLVGGRCIAGDNGSHAAMRNMMACTVSGGGAGVAGAVYCQMGSGKSLQRLIKETPEYVVTVQSELRRQGVDLYPGVKSKL